MKKYCPECGALLIERKRKKDGVLFLGCSDFPNCSYAEPYPEEWKMREQGQPEHFAKLPDGS